MIYLDLLLGFLKVGLFSFGGAYSSIPLVREIVHKYGWLTDEVLTHMIAVSESTPGPITVNLATYVGSSQAGVLGAAIATLSVILPAFFIILLIMVALKKVLESKYVQAVLDGLKPCIAGIITATGVYMAACGLFQEENASQLDWRAVVITAVLGAGMIVYRRIKKKRLSPILIIVASAVLGIILY